MVRHLPESNAFEFVVVSTLRAQQLMRGCVARVAGDHKATTTAQLEVAAGKIVKLTGSVPASKP